MTSAAEYVLLSFNDQDQDALLVKNTLLLNNATKTKRPINHE